VLEAGPDLHLFGDLPVSLVGLEDPVPVPGAAVSFPNRGRYRPYPSFSRSFTGMNLSAAELMQ
jgi:hypothetical protein